MAKRTVTVTLTQLEAQELLNAAGNGADDGSFWVNDDGSDTGYGGKRALNAYYRAREKLQNAMRR